MYTAAVVGASGTGSLIGELMARAGCRTILVYCRDSWCASSVAMRCTGLREENPSTACITTDARVWMDIAGHRLDLTKGPMTVQKDLMRHADIKTTMNVYGKAMAEPMREAHSKVVKLVIQERSAIGVRVRSDSFNLFKLNELWRRDRDSNPGYPFEYTRFPSVRLQPLGHLSD